MDKVDTRDKVEAVDRVDEVGLLQHPGKSELQPVSDHYGEDEWMFVVAGIAHVKSMATQTVAPIDVTEAPPDCDWHSGAHGQAHRGDSVELPVSTARA